MQMYVTSHGSYQHSWLGLKKGYDSVQSQLCWYEYCEAEDQSRVGRSSLVGFPTAAHVHGLVAATVRE